MDFVDDDAAYISPNHYATLGDHTVIAEDVLIAGLGDENHPAGRACVAPIDIEPAMVKADCFRFRLDRLQVRPSFVAYFLTATAREATAVLSTGATRQRINLYSMSNRPIFFPGIAEQEAVIETVRKETTNFECAVSAARREIMLLKEYHTRLVADVVTGKLDVRAAAAALPEIEEEPEAIEAGDEAENEEATLDEETEVEDAAA